MQAKKGMSKLQERIAHILKPFEDAGLKDFVSGVFVPEDGIDEGDHYGDPHQPAPRPAFIKRDDEDWST